MKRRAEKCAIFCPVALQGKKKVICVLTQTSIQKLPLKFARRCHGKYLSNDFLEKEQPHQKKVSWKQSRKKAKAPAVKRFYCSFTIYMKVFCYYRSFGSKQTTMYPPTPPAFIPAPTTPPTPRPHRLIHFAVFSNTPLPPFPLLIKASRFTGTEEYGLFVLFVQ